VVVTVYVPIGKRIKVNGIVSRINTVKFNGPFSVNNSYSEFEDISFDRETGWETGEWYTMTKDGLVSDNAKDAINDSDEEVLKINKNGIDINDGDKKIRIDENGIKVEESNNQNNNGGGSYRYDSNIDSKKDSVKMKLENIQKRFNDSIQKEKDKIDKQNAVAINNETTLLVNGLPTNLLTKFF
jgi:hypothetical protein